MPSNYRRITNQHSRTTRSKKLQITGLPTLLPGATAPVALGSVVTPGKGMQVFRINVQQQEKDLGSIRKG
jgi:hypothetical protein